MFYNFFSPFFYLKKVIYASFIFKPSKFKCTVYIYLYYCNYYIHMYCLYFLSAFLVQFKTRKLWFMLCSFFVSFPKDKN